jgi:predicted Zn-dependent protease
MNTLILRKRSSILMISLLLATSCSKVPVTNRKQMNLIPESELVSMSLTSYQAFLKENPPLPVSDPNVKLVKNTGNRLASAVKNFMTSKKMGDRVKDYKWEFNLVQSNELNAWCMPGGKVVVYTGLLPVTADEAGLAFVMGHEVAHAVARHGNERMSQQLLAATGGIALDVAMSEQPSQTRDMMMAAYGVGSQVGVLLPFSRLHESEADKLGMIFMAMAGYDPAQAPLVWERMMSKSQGPKPPELLSTHPVDEKRIKELRKYIPEARKYYKK